MNTELRLHGRINADIEYYATAAGALTDYPHFYQLSEQQLRLFAPNNELILDHTGVQQQSNGGAFCEYMFGVDQPRADLTKPGVQNRLILLGASYDEQGLLSFSEQRQARHSYEQIFFEGHATHNYFFFVAGLDERSFPRTQQQILRCLGRSLKRLAGLNQGDDSLLASKLLALLPENCTLFLVRLIDIRQRRYQQEFQRLYYQQRNIPEEDFCRLQSLANDLGLERYQQERIRVDVMYRHRDNYRLVDEYKRILVDCHRQGALSHEQHARLIRLKTLSVRNKIPAALFLTLDEQLKVQPEEAAPLPDYIVTTRQFLRQLFASGQSSEPGVDAAILEQLLFAKHQAHCNRDHSFEQLLLETGKICDEQIRDGAPLTLLENFSAIVTFFDRYDTTSTFLSQLAFMENFQLTEDILRSLEGNRQAFNQLNDTLFDRLFFEQILENGYLGRFGRRKLLVLQQGLAKIAAAALSLAELADQFQQLAAEERLYNTVLQNAKQRIRNRYSRYETPAEQQALFSELSDELLVRGIISDLLDPQLFRSVIHDIKKEAIYLHTLLPEIIVKNDRELREDFLSNSGLDRFYVEELEREYFSHNQLDIDQLNRMRADNC